MTSILSESTNSNDEEEDVGLLVREAYQLLAENRLEESIAIYERIIREYPRCWRAYQNLGVAYIMRKEYEKANAALKTYVQHVPRDPLGHDSLGVSFSELNDPLQAICSFVNSINLSPNYYMSYYNLGVVLGKLSLYDYALNVYLYCLDLQPNYINAMNNVADIYKKQGRINEAIVIFKEIIEIDPSYTLAIKNLGNCYFAQEKYYDALLTYFKVGNVDTYHESVLFNIALCLDHFELYRQAGGYAFKAHLKSNLEGNDSVSVHQTFIAGTILAKEMHCLNKVIRTYTKFRKEPPEIINERFYNSYLQAISCFNIAKESGLGFEEVEENIKRTSLRFIGYEMKSGRNEVFMVYKDLLTEQTSKFIQEQQALIPEILNWRKFTKRKVQKIIKNKDEEFEKQKQSLMEIFGKPCYHDVESYQYKTKSYISRRFNHNLKRLILKRHKFIKKFEKLNKKSLKLFQYKKLKITLTEPESINEISEVQK